MRVFLAVVTIGLLAAAPPVGADNLGGKQAKTKGRQAQVQGQLDLTLASQATVDAEVNRLTAEVSAKQIVLQEARSQEDDAAIQLADATILLADTSNHLDHVKQQMRDLAISAYLRSSQPSPSENVTDVNELARRQVMLSLATSAQTQLITTSRRAKNDQGQAQKGMQVALTSARARTGVATNQAAQLVEAQRAQQAAQAELQKRVAALRKESSDLALQEQGIEALIAGQDAVTQAALARMAAQRQAAASAGLPAASNGGATYPSAAATAAGLIWPIRGPVTSEFGPRWGGIHPGIDIAPPFGTPIHAAQAGVVIFAGAAGGYGNFVLIDHGGGVVTGYAHQSQLAATRGDTVTQGQLIGYEGSTGDSTGPHLHFEVRVNGSAQNPRDYESGNP